MIRAISSAQLDSTAYDRCIYNSRFFRYEALSGFLHALTNGKWFVLVEGDYENVMPIPYNRKLLLKQMFQPYSTQQLGIFGKNQTVERFKMFLQELPNHVIRWHFQCPNYSMNELNETLDFQYSLRDNFLLPISLSDPRSFYHENALRNLRKAEKSGIEIRKGRDVSTLIEAYQQHLAEQTKGVTAKHYQNLKKAFAWLDQEGMVSIVQAWQKDTFLAQALFIQYQDHIFYPLGVTHPEGKKNGAMTLIFDYVIRSNAGRGRVLDFEGSTIEGIARFFKGFGAVHQPYWQIKGYKGA